MTLALEIDGVVKTFGRVRAVDGLTLSVKEGELYVLLGPNGAGKTTTLKMVTGLLSPDEGRLRILGRDVSRDGPEAKQSLGYIPDRAQFYEDLRGEEFLSFLSGLHGLAQGPRAGQLLERFGLKGMAARRIRDMSQGMRQKLAFCACFLHEPRMVVVDEPWVGLDPQGVRAAIDYLKEANRAGVAIILSTHSLSIAEEIADRIGVMSQGKLVAEGRLSDLVKDQRLEARFLELTGSDGEDGRLDA